MNQDGRRNAKLLVAGEAPKAIFWPTPGLKVKKNNKKTPLTALDSQQRELARGRKVETASVKQDCLGIAIVLTASKFIFVIFALPDTGQWPQLSFASLIQTKMQRVSPYAEAAGQHLALYHPNMQLETGPVKGRLHGEPQLCQRKT